MISEETQTASANKDEKTAWSKLCRRNGVNPNLVMLKITLFMMHGATSCLWPYLTIHMQSIGLSVEEMAFIYLALPFTTFIAPPITGFLVDKFGKFKPVIIVAFLLNALFHHALFLIPQQEIPGVMPFSYVMRHPDTGNVEVWWSPCPSRSCTEKEELNIVLDSCIDHCLLLELDPKINVVPHGKLNSRVNDDLDDLNFKISKNKPTDKPGKVLSSTTNSPGSSSGSKQKTPLSSLKDEILLEQLSLNESESEESWVVGSDEVAFFFLDMHPNLGDAIERLGMEVEEDSDAIVTDFIQRFGEKLLWDKGVNVTELQEADLRCGGLVLHHNITITEERLKELAEDCMVQKCEFIQGGPEICPSDFKESDKKTFWIYFALRFMGTMMLSGGITMMDPIALMTIEKYGGDFGRERLFSMFGMAVCSPITGVLIDYFSGGLGYTDYSAAFYMYDLLLVISSISVLLMPLGEKIPGENIFSDFINLLKMPHVMCFIIFMFVLGNFWGFIESFLFLYLKELGASNYLLGITVTVGTVSSIPFLYTAEKITSIFGHVNLIVIAFFSHACRLVGYSFIDNAWWCFPFEAMEAFSCHLMWVAAATYCSVLAPKNLLATLIGVLGMAHYSLGKGSGSFAGGFLISEMGTREAFRFMGMTAAGCGLAYKAIHLVWLKKFDKIVNEADAVESGETDKLTQEPKTRDASTDMSQERLTLMVSHNQVGSLSSLWRNSKMDIRRRSSYSSSVKGDSASKIDLLKSALEINQTKSSNQALRKESKSVVNSLKSVYADSAPKLTLNVGIAEDLAEKDLEEKKDVEKDITADFVDNK